MAESPHGTHPLRSGPDQPDASGGRARSADRMRGGPGRARARPARRRHPRRGGRRRARLARALGRAPRLARRLGHARARERGRLARPRDRARPPRGPRPEKRGPAGVRAGVAKADAWEGALANGWSSGEAVIGAGGEQPGAPWAEHERVAVVPLRRGARAYGVIAVALGEHSRVSALAWLGTAASVALGAQARAAQAPRAGA